MTILFRTIVIVLVLAAPVSLWAIGLHFVRIPSDSQKNAHRRDEEVEHLEQALKRREEARHQAVQELLSQRCTLPQTLQRFQELNQEWPDLSAMAQVARAEESDEQIAYRLVIQHVQSVLSERAAESTAILRRLENDYQQLQSGRAIPTRLAGGED